MHSLKVGDRVKTSGVEIGFVEEITLNKAERKMRVTMKIRPKVSVPIDSVAIINSEEPKPATFFGTGCHLSRGASGNAGLFSHG